MLPILRISNVGPSIVRIGWLAVYKLHNQYLQMHLLYTFSFGRDPNGKKFEMPKYYRFNQKRPVIKI
jgi:hypothetical protein